MDNLERKLIELVQGNLPLTENPYASIAQEMGVTEDDVVKMLKALNECGKLKRIGAILRHQKSGFGANAMAVFKVDTDQVDALGEALTQCKMVSHCYERATFEAWPYNLYAMMHSRQEAEIFEFVASFAKEHDIVDYTVLKSVEELKKTSMIFI